VQREILERFGGSSLRVYAVWVPFNGGSEQAADVSQRVLSDPRVVHVWDGEAATSDWFAENVEESFAPAWDVYYLYGPDATWTDVPGPLIGSGATIIGRSSALHDAIVPLLRGATPVA
jgi:hypothetical protein